MKNILIAAILIFSIFTINAQEAEKKSRKEIKAEKKAQEIEDVKAIIESKTFVFDVTTVNPMRGRTVNPTTAYDVRITKDSIYSYLPYFGVAYSTSYGGTDSPMIFSEPFESCDFEKTKKGYEVSTVVKNSNDRLEYNFHITETGSTSLVVTSSNRQSISYNGYLEIIKDEKK